MSCINFSGPWNCSRWVDWNEWTICLHLPVFWLLWVPSVNPSVMSLSVCTDVSVCTCTCTYRYSMCTCMCPYWAQVVAWCRCVCMGCHRIQDHRLPPSDLTQPWTLLPLRSIRIIYPTPSLSSRLMHRGVKHLVMLNHSGAQHARSHPEWQHRAGEGCGRWWGGEIPHRPQGKERGRWRGEKGSGLEGFRGREKRGKGVGGTSGSGFTSTEQGQIWKCCQSCHVFRCPSTKNTKEKTRRYIFSLCFIS